jgi:hypothetical protein
MFVQFAVHTYIRTDIRTNFRAQFFVELLMRRFYDFKCVVQIYTLRPILHVRSILVVTTCASTQETEHCSSAIVDFLFRAGALQTVPV